MHKVILVMGPYRESGRLIPLYFALEKMGFAAFIGTSSSKDAVIQEMLTLFGLKSDIEIACDESKGDQAFLTDGLLKQCNDMILHYKPSLIITEGHSIVSVASALAASYHQIPVCQLESDSKMLLGKVATGRDMHRRFMHLMATYHIASTAAAAAHILAQGIRRDSVFCVGDTYVDLLKSIQEKITNQAGHSFAPRLSAKSHELLVSFDIRGLTNIDLETISFSLNRLLDTTQYLWITLAVDKQIPMLRHERLFVASPCTYRDSLSHLFACDSVLTDSYYLHEEAVCLDKPVIFLRREIDRVETIWAGLTYPTGVDSHKIVDAFANILMHYKPGKAGVLYGQGDAANKIATILAARIQNTFLTGPKHAFCKPNL